jgi:hypothetical protein
MKEAEDWNISGRHAIEGRRFIVLCMSKEQAHLFMHCSESQADKTFSRTKCRKWEVNSYDVVTRRTTTLARIFFDCEDADSYDEVWKMMFDQAEKDIGHKVPFGHLITDADSPTKSRIKAILLDEHGGQLIRSAIK